MTVIHLPAPGSDDRRAIAATLARTIARHSETRIGPTLGAFHAAVAGSETAPDLNLSGLDRRNLAMVLRVVQSVSEQHGGQLGQFARAIEDADRSANPTANPLRHL